MQRRSYKAGELIFEAEEKPSEAYILMNGEVEIHRGEFAAGLNRGDVFGESALMGHPRMASAVAKTDCSLLVFSREEMEEAIRRDPTQAFEIIDALLARLADVTDQLQAERKKNAG
ncbi:Crp/Fnr family transcriptional regulator [Limibacillus halophilus]|jgi:CRP/FNR family cyclic AMP-dependent transcriptional regulator